MFNTYIYINIIHIYSYIYIGGCWTVVVQHRKKHQPTQKDTWKVGSGAVVAVILEYSARRPTILRSIASFMVVNPTMHHPQLTIATLRDQFHHHQKTKNVCMYVRTYVCMYVGMYVCICMYACMYVCVCMCMYVYVCVCMCMYVYVSM